MKTHSLIATQGCGSVIVEILFELGAVPYAVEYMDYSVEGAERERLIAKNPLGQVPTLILPNGEVMTESAAIALYVADLAPQANLAPPPGDGSRTKFLRWLVFLVSAVYPTFTYGDDPKKWLDGDENAGKVLRKNTDQHRQKLWGWVEKETSAPWFLGERFSAIDVYLLAMSFWRPGRK